MNRTLTPAAALGALALLAAPAGAAASPRCAALQPTGLKLHANAAGDNVSVSWRVPAHHPAKLAFRVARDGAVIGQTAGHRMHVRVRPGHGAKITVTPVVAGKPVRCRAVARYAAGRARPGAVAGLAARPHGRRAVVLTWDAAKAGARPVARYQLLRDGHGLRRLHGRSATVGVARRAHRYQVAAVDTAGRLGLRSATVTVKAGHRAPTRPGAPAVSAVGDTSATLSWTRAKAKHGRIASYRVTDAAGRTLFATHGTSVRLTNLGSARTHSYRVIAVDSLGWASAPSAVVTVTTGHTAPAAPAAPTPVSVSDTTVTLMWAPVAASTGAKLRGYRVMRDGVVVQQVPSNQAVIVHLAPKSVHDWSVAAVDSLGYASAPSVATRVVQADPPPSVGSAQAFLLASTDASFAAFQRHYRQIGVVYPTFYDCDTTTGGITGSNDPLIVRYAQDRKVKVLPRFNCLDTDTEQRILNDASLRESWLDAMVGAVVKYGYDGMNLDFERVRPEDRGALTSFVRDLAARLHARGKLLSEAVSAKTHDIPNHSRSGAFDYPALANYDDYIFVMGWGLHWSTSTPGSQDDINWFTQVADYVASMPHHERFVMGTMLYGLDWPAGGGTDHPAAALHYTETTALLARYHATPTLDTTTDSWRATYTDAAGVAHELSYSDAQTTGDRMAVAHARGLGIGFWRIGQEDERIWANPLMGGA